MSGTVKLSEMVAQYERMEKALQEIMNTSPEGDSAYRYGYAWEKCKIIASRALLGKPPK